MRYNDCTNDIREIYRNAGIPARAIFQLTRNENGPALATALVRSNGNIEILSLKKFGPFFGRFFNLGGPRGTRQKTS
jgi:hypothetical protein